MNRSFAFLAILTAAMSATSPALAAPVANAGPMIVPDSGDTGWLLASLCIGLLAAIPGIVVYAIGGHGRAAARILTAVTAAIALATLLFFLIGYSLVFDLAGGPWIGANSNWMLGAMGTVREGTTLPETGFVLFQLGFVLIAVVLLAALLAPRARPGWLLGFSGLWMMLVLVPVMRWTWGGGWLAEMGTMDGAGGLVLFYTTAVSAFTAMVLIGRKKDAEAIAPDHGLRLIGASLLLVGMAAMAGGSTLGASDNAAVAMLTMITAGMTGALTNTVLNRRLDADALATGIVAGVVASATAGDGISIGSAWLTGAIATIAVHITPRLMPKRFAWQDVDGSAVTIAAAAKTGGLLFAVFLAFAPFGGSGYGEGMTMGSQFIAQITAILAIALWSIFGTLVCALMAGLVLPMQAEE